MSADRARNCRCGSIFGQDQRAKVDYLFAKPYSAGDPIKEADSLNLNRPVHVRRRHPLGGGQSRCDAGAGCADRGGRSDVIDSLDYLSTGLGRQLHRHLDRRRHDAAAASSTPLPPNRYPYESKTDGSETPETAHLRDYSSYLTPNGLSDVIANLLIVARGLVGNIVMLLGALLFLAMLQLTLTPTTDYLLMPRSLQLFGSMAAYRRNGPSV